MKKGTAPNPKLSRLPRHAASSGGAAAMRRAVAALLASRGIAASEARINDFINWQLAEQWQRYNDYLMDQKVLLRNALEAVHNPFPNGRQGEPYDHSVEIRIENLGRLWVEDFDIAGLSITYDPPTSMLRISGTPAVAGDFDFRIMALTSDAAARGEGRDEAVARRVGIAFNADPRSLWKDIPTPDDIPFAKPDSDNAFIELPETVGGGEEADGRHMLMVAASRRGRSHAHEGLPRDDDFAIADAGHGWRLAVVADGAGSARYSRRGSQIACNVVSRDITDKLTAIADDFEDAIRAVRQPGSGEQELTTLNSIAHRILYESAFRANRAIREEAEHTEGAQPKDFATTLLVCLTKKFEFGWFVASFWVGDGAIAIFDAATQSVRLLGEPDGGEFAGQTRFLTMESIFSDHNRMRFSIVDGFTAIMLMTDGVSDPKFETDANLKRPALWEALWSELSDAEVFGGRPAQAPTRLLKWLDFWSKGNHDDRTIAIIH